MGKVTADISMSLDGFIAGPNDRPGNGLGDGGERLHQWVTDLAQARAAAGDKDVAIGGGANTIQQFIAAGLLDEIQIHLVPVLLGDGIRLFEQLGGEPIELEGTRVVASPDVTHLRFDVER